MQGLEQSFGECRQSLPSTPSALTLTSPALGAGLRRIPRLRLLRDGGARACVTRGSACRVRERASPRPRRDLPPSQCRRVVVTARPRDAGLGCRSEVRVQEVAERSRCGDRGGVRAGNLG